MCSFDCRLIENENFTSKLASNSDGFFDQEELEYFLIQNEKGIYKNLDYFYVPGKRSIAGVKEKRRV